MPCGIASDALPVHPAGTTEVTRCIETGYGRMKNMDFPTEFDIGFNVNIIWNRTVGMLSRIEKQLELGGKVGLVDVLRQMMEIPWILSF